MNNALMLVLPQKRSVIFTLLVHVWPHVEHHVYQTLCWIPKNLHHLFPPQSRKSASTHVRLDLLLLLILRGVFITIDAKIPLEER